MATRFEAGLAQSARLREIDEFVAPPGYRIDLIKTDGRDFFLERRFLQLENLYVREVSEAAGISRRGECLDDTISFGVATEARQLPRVRGCALRLDQIAT